MTEANSPFQFIGIFILFFSALISQSPTFAQDSTSESTLDWYADIEEALKDEDTDGKYVMLYFSGSDWCKPCIQLNNNILDTDTFSEYATVNLVPVKLDFPKMKKNRLSKSKVIYNEALAEKYNPNGVFPLLVFLDKNEEMIGFTGFTDVSPQAYVSIIEKIIGR